MRASSTIRSDKNRPRLSVVAAKLLTILLCLAALPSFAQTNATNRFKSKPGIVAPANVSEPKEITLASVDGVISSYHKCTTSVGQIYLAGLPAATVADCKLIADLEQHAANEKERIRVEMKRIRDAQAKLPANFEYQSPVWYYRNQLAKEYQIANNREQDLRESNDKLAAAKERFAKSSKLNAVDTGRLYGVIPIWRVVPEKK